VNSKAVSDVLASVILIAIVIAGFAGIVYPMLLRYAHSSQSQLEQNQKSLIQSEALITPVYSYEKQSNGQTAFYVYLYNYGRVSFSPQEFIVSMPNAGTYVVTSFNMYNAQTGSSVSSIQPGIVVKVVFSIQYSDAVPSTINLTALGNGMSFSWEV